MPVKDGECAWGDVQIFIGGKEVRPLKLETKFKVRFTIGRLNVVAIIPTIAVGSNASWPFHLHLMFLGWSWCFSIRKETKVIDLKK